MTAAAKDPEAIEALKKQLEEMPSPDKVDDWGAHLPMFFRLKGRPLTMERHRPLSFFYKRIPAWKTLAICGRQVGKSAGICGSGALSALLLPNTSALYVTPLFEQTRRLSSNTMRPLLLESPVPRMFQNSRCEKSVLQKTLVNGSIMHFSFAFLDCERTRGISADRIYYDEVQGFDPSFLDIIAETMSAATGGGVAYYTGTPLTLDNTIEGEWQKSSKGEWRVDCDHCGHVNYMSTKYHLDQMIGTVKQVRLHGTGLVCARCKLPIHAIRGRWAHQHPERIFTHAGYHLPQPALPLHYASERHWAVFLDKYEHKPRNIVMNECLGESCDTGTHLVSKTHLERASRLPWTLEEAFDQPDTDAYRRRYRLVAMGVDWGGGGSRQESSTAVSICGMTGSGDIEVVYVERLPFNYTPQDELERLFRLYRKFNCRVFAHDWGGAGRKADTLVRQAKVIPAEQIMPIGYVATGARDLITHNPAITASGFYTYSLDKTWSLALLCELVKEMHVVFPRWQENVSGPLLEDFLHLVESRRERNFAGDLYLIVRQPGQKDDVVHAVNFAACALFHGTGNFPDIAESFRSARFRMQGDRMDDYDIEMIKAHRDLTLEDWEPEGY